jgi:hypothetical protein
MMNRRLIGCGLCVVVMGCSVGCSKAGGGVVADEAGASVAAKAAPPPAIKAPEVDLRDTIQAEPTLAAGLAVAKPKMEDTSKGEMDAGSSLLAIWAMKKMRWSDVGVVKDETSFALMQKDSEEERGKRLCVSGTIIQIEVVKTPRGKLYDGLFTDGASHLYKFMAVGSTGSLVERSYARLCGVATGTYDYPNSGGGTGHAIKIVGMFDLAANKGT